MNAKKKMVSVAVWCMAVMVVMGFALAAQADLQIPVNVMSNGNFESGPNWDGTTTPPQGWKIVNSSPSVYLDPTVAPLGGLRSLFTREYPDNGQVTVQDGLVMNPHWKMTFDFALEDPPIARDQLSMSLHIGPVAYGPSYISAVNFKDNNPNNGVLDVYSGATYLGPVPGFAFSSNITNSPIKHVLMVEGHFDLLTPTWDLTVKNAFGGTLASFTGLTVWGDLTPTGGTNSPNWVAFVGDVWSSGKGKIDNIEMGSWEIPEPSSVLLFGLGGLLTLRRFRRR